MISYEKKINTCSHPEDSRNLIEEFDGSNHGGGNIDFKYTRPMSDGMLVRRCKCLTASLRGQRPELAVTFGHFLVGSFARFTLHGFEPRTGFQYATFLREPLQRAVSHYYYWKRTYLGEHKAWNRFIKENWSLERFLLSTEYANFQSEFLWNFSLAHFDFVGLAERYEESVAMLGVAFPSLKGLAIRAENANVEKSIGGNYPVNSALAERFRQINARDYVLYEKAVEIFERQRLKFAMNQK